MFQLSGIHQTVDFVEVRSWIDLREVIGWKQIFVVSSSTSREVDDLYKTITLS